MVRRINAAWLTAIENSPFVMVQNLDLSPDALLFVGHKRKVLSLAKTLADPRINSLQQYFQLLI